MEWQTDRFEVGVFRWKLITLTIPVSWKGAKTITIRLMRVWARGIITLCFAFCRIECIRGTLTTGGLLGDHDPHNQSIITGSKSLTFTGSSIMKLIS